MPQKKECKMDKPKKKIWRPNISEIKTFIAIGEKYNSSPVFNATVVKNLINWINICEKEINDLPLLSLISLVKYVWEKEEEDCANHIKEGDGDGSEHIFADIKKLDAWLNTADIHFRRGED